MKSKIYILLMALIVLVAGWVGANTEGNIETIIKAGMLGGFSLALLLVFRGVSFTSRKTPADSLSD